MNEQQFAERIGGIDDRLVQEAAEGRARRRRGSVWKRLASAAAVIALMAASGAIGAFAFSDGGPEELRLGEIGLTLLVPDEYRGQFAVTQDGDNYIIYSPEIRQAWEQWAGESLGPADGGMLCYILRIDEALTEEQTGDESEWNFAAHRYLFATGDCTYLLYYASDVQFPPEKEEAYRQLETGVHQLRIVVDELLG